MKTKTKYSLIASLLMAMVILLGAIMSLDITVTKVQASEAEHNNVYKIVGSTTNMGMVYTEFLPVGTEVTFDIKALSGDNTVWGTITMGQNGAYSGQLSTGLPANQGSLKKIETDSVGKHWVLPTSYPGDPEGTTIKPGFSLRLSSWGNEQNPGYINKAMLTPTSYYAGAANNPGQAYNDASISGIDFTQRQIFTVKYYTNENPVDTANRMDVTYNGTTKTATTWIKNATALCDDPGDVAHRIGYEGGYLSIATFNPNGAFIVYGVDAKFPDGTQKDLLADESKWLFTDPVGKGGVTNIGTKRVEIGNIPTENKMNIADSPVQLTYTGYGEVVGTDIVWTSSQTSVATVENGLLTPVAQGTTEIKAELTIDGEKYTDTFVLTVVDPSAVQTYNVNFYNGNELLYTAKGVMQGMTAEYQGEVPVKDGYRFTGWDKPLTNISEDTDVYAQFIKVWTVTFKDGNTVLKTETVDEGSAAVAPENVTKDGYRFDGWDKEFENIVADTEINAQFVKVWTVTFKDGETILKTQIVDEGGSAAAPEDTDKDGYRFNGWDKEFTNITEDTVVNAIYLKIYTVQFKDFDGRLIDSQEVLSGEAATAPESPAREGYVFKGWDKDFTAVETDLTVMAVYNRLYTVTFKNGDNVITEIEVEEGQSATAPEAPAAEKGYKFVGWDQSFDKVTQDLTVNAVFEKARGCASSVNAATFFAAIPVLFAVVLFVRKRRA